MVDGTGSVIRLGNRAVGSNPTPGSISTSNRADNRGVEAAQEARIRAHRDNKTRPFALPRARRMTGANDCYALTRTVR